MIILVNKVFDWLNDKSELFHNFKFVFSCLFDKTFTFFSFLHCIALRISVC